MNKIFDYGFEDSFFTQDIKALMDINMKRIHMIRIDDNDYLDKNKADVFKDYMKNMPEDELYITTAYISCEEFSPNKYCIFKIRELIYTISTVFIIPFRSIVEWNRYTVCCKVICQLKLKRVGV